MRSTSPTGSSSQEMDRALFEHVLNVARRLSSSSDLNEVLGLIIDTLRDSLHADRVSVFQYDAATHELFATKAHGLPQSLRLPADKGIIGEAARTKQIITIVDAYADPRFNPAVDKATGYRTRCMLTIPLLDFEAKLVGVAQLLNKSPEHGGVFGPEDELIAGHLADQAGMALKRAALLEARRIKEKLEADIDVARKIQQSSIARELPKLPGYDVVGHFNPADETAGDAYDVIDLRACSDTSVTWDAASADALVFMADATGHGIGPALSVAQVLAMVRMGCRLGAELEEIAKNVNRQLCRDLPMGRFVTSFMGQLSLATNELSYLSAGQAPIIFVKASGEVASSDPTSEGLNANAMPLGIDDDFLAERAAPLRFGVGDAFVMLSDGYYEASNEAGDMFGIDRVLAAVRSKLGSPAREILSAIHESLAAFVGKKPADDDQTAIIITRTS